jgi:hypothetical protein
MAKDVVVKDTDGKGKGLFANRDFMKGEVILFYDLSKNKEKYTLKEIEESGIDSEHWVYVGHGRYVLDFSPASYVNHSCNPNAYEEFQTLYKRYLIAIRSIKKGEEITKDYTLVAVDQIDNETWILECKCRNKNCRRIVTGDFFKLPKEIQKEKLPYLPTWTKRKYRDRIKNILK